jgi:Uma2 family endonuclease
MALAKFIPNYTVEDYRSWKGSWELWSGVPIAMTPSSKQEHQRISGRVFRQLSAALEDAGCSQCEVFYELDWVVSLDTVFRPDLMIVCGHEPSDFVEKVPSLIVEILSDSTRKRDLLYKRDHYERLGVRHYIIVDPAAQTCTALLNSDSGFSEHSESKLVLDDGCEVNFEAGNVFP